METNNLMENKRTGFVVIYRSITDNWIWQDAEKLKWWLDILLKANYEEKKVVLGNEFFVCKRGEFITSYGKLSEKWRVSKDKVRNYLKLLEKDGMITLKNIRKATQIIVCNYESYQNLPNANQTQTKRKPNANQTQTKRKPDTTKQYNNITNKQINNNNNRQFFQIFELAKKGFTIQEISIYIKENIDLFIKQGFKPDEQVYLTDDIETLYKTAIFENLKTADSYVTKLAMDNKTDVKTIAELLNKFNTEKFNTKEYLSGETRYKQYFANWIKKQLK